MKQQIVSVALLIGMLALVGCEKENRDIEVYSFPKEISQITCSFYSQGKENILEIEPTDFDAISKWFCNLELTACDEPEAVEGGEAYCFMVNGKDAFDYEDRGGKSYIISGKNSYKVSNPSIPPIREKNID